MGLSWKYYFHLLQIPLCIFIKGLLASMSSSQSQLTEDLLINKKYDFRIRPSLFHKDTVNVTLGLAINMIENLDEKRQVLTIRAEFYQHWYDYRLRWKPTDYEGIEVISLDPKLIWLPDIILQNNAQGHFGEGRKRINALIKYDGLIVVDHPAIFKGSCGINIKSYPFDKQVCNLIFRSWAFDERKIRLLLKSHEVDRTRHIPEGGWDLKSTSAVKGSLRTEPNGKVFDIITFSLSLHRLSLYHAMYYIIPCAMIGFMTAVVFMLPANINERMTVGLTLLIALSFFFLLMAEKSPAISEDIPMAALYYTITTVLSTFAYFMTCGVLRCYYSNPLQGEVPQWMRELVFNYIGKALYVNCKKTREHHCKDDMRRNLVSPAQSNKETVIGTTMKEVKDETKFKSGSTLKFRLEEDRDANNVIVENLKQQEILAERVAEWEEVANILNRLFIIIYISSFGLSSIIVFSQSASS